jgi:hypothetical protein
MTEILANFCENIWFSENYAKVVVSESFRENIFFSDIGMKGLFLHIMSIKFIYM